MVDFPDPTNYSLGKLYTTAFYRLLARHLARDGPDRRAEHVAAVRAPVLLVHRRDARSRRACARTPTTCTCRRSANGASCWPAATATSCRRRAAGGLRFLTARQRGRAVRVSRPTCGRVDAEPNRLNDQVLVRYYEHEWGEIAH